MGKRAILILLMCLLIISTLLIGACAKAPAPEAAKKGLLIAVNATFTGGLGATGAHVCPGGIDYFRWIASQGGIEYKDPTSGKTERAPLKVIWEDMQFDVAKSTAAYKRFKAAGANAIWGFGSTPGEACAASASRDKLPYLSWYAYASPQGYAPKPQYYWTCLPMIAESSTPMAKWLIKEKYRGTQSPKIGYLVTDLPSWRPVAKPGLTDGYIKSIGGELVGIEFLPTLTTDVSVPITRLVVEKKADCLLLIGTLDQTVVAAKDMRRLGIDLNKVTLIVNPSAWDESLLKFREVDGVYGECGVALPEEGAAGWKLVNQVAKWAGKPAEEMTVNYAMGMVGGQVLIEAIKRALEKEGYQSVASSGEPIRYQLATFAPMDTAGLAYKVGLKYPDIEPFFLTASRMTQAKDGKLKMVSDWIEYDIIKGALD